ncbi:DUF6719 family protein [Lichenifustis flavocetrariae]|uniref:Uncharacterized protein n=1 Tax=Lichenifustis flavocetrariae TaxID=2949735 RepID=A0AA41Z805_9HYPH|nr:DUF6719 family protein [Lichenifustis flavocetrariae]MCW6510962.1 hypothetical protein [Lichenifustis flavocetrariae]
MSRILRMTTKCASDPAFEMEQEYNWSPPPPKKLRIFYDERHRVPEARAARCQVAEDRRRTMMLVKAGAVAVILAAFSTGLLAAPRASALEPAAGTLPEGQSMLVDDGTCPKGKIKQITGGNTKVGAPRVRTCVRR